ncbi:dihydrolipoamide acetyltransferase family protein [Saccharopolyspora dendranthemae]|uniref:Dihydrolipoamide acetyltransferase component of pyruvate dehydrogenase complex n=1 Tax=Saccharopolyspora dendranthemae TaxID=1181886 RepID=A0A561U7M0_9PSEU|nr:dihydrolipoamide acetyltransferase family protein [Saccharopolyspora dendranthemae]TWF95357.1 pyruvate dehydrogenase E2 component (dihydrolipoamide acetyltransferase) [Saccharopolyspora dendranthemae]
MSENVFTLPDLGEGLTEATLLRWLVKVGDVVSVDAPVAEVETAKAAVEVPSPHPGVVARLHGEEGEVLTVGAPLITVESGGAGEVHVEEERAGSGNVLIGYGTTGDRPGGRRRRRRRAPEPVSRPGDSPAVQSPIVRQLARKRGLDLRELAGTGPNGLITRQDVESARHAAEEPADTDRRTGLGIGERVPLTGLRKSVADALTRSRAEIPEATTWVDVDATALLELRASLGEKGSAPGVLAMVARYVVAGLVRFPELNSRVDTERGEIVHLDGVNLGIAAQTERGLVVPAVRGAHRLGMRGLDAEIGRLTAAARDGSASPADLSCGSFTLNNYGVLGVDGSAAIINHPEVAILGMGRILPRPWVVDGELVARRVVQLSLAFDHRVCDGGTAGGFLRFVADAIEDPTSAMTDL